MLVQMMITSKQNILLDWNTEVQINQKDYSKIGSVENVFPAGILG